MSETEFVPDVVDETTDVGEVEHWICVVCNGFRNIFELRAANPGWLETLCGYAVENTGPAPEKNCDRCQAFANVDTCPRGHKKWGI